MVRPAFLCQPCVLQPEQAGGEDGTRGEAIARSAPRRRATGRSRMETVKAALRGIGRFIRKVRDLASGDDLHEAQTHRGDKEEHRANPWPR